MNDNKDAFDLWWEWAEKPLDSPLTIDATIHDAVMALPPDRGFGFIKDDSGGPDIFMHISSLQGIDPDNLRLGERLSFDVERDIRSGKIKAANVRRSG